MPDWLRFGEIAMEAFDGRLDQHDFQLLWMVSEIQEPSLNRLSNDPDHPRLDKATIYRKLRRLEKDWFTVGVQDRKRREFRDYDVTTYQLTPKGQVAAVGVLGFRRQLAGVVATSNWYKRPAFWCLQSAAQTPPARTSLAAFVDFYSRFYLMVGHNLPLKTMLSNSQTIEDLAMLWQEVLIADLDNMEGLAKKHGYVIPPGLKTIRAERLKAAKLFGDKWAPKWASEDQRHKVRELTQASH